MKWCAAIVGACLSLSYLITPASADVRIRADGGGEVGSYLYKFALIRQSGERVIIDGPCLSACTLLLAIIPRDRVCATERAHLGFHAARYVSDSGRLVMTTEGTRRVMAIYPPAVQRWIRSKGGLNGHMIYMRGAELAAYVPRCG
jgi:hypothetical protein